MIPKTFDALKHEQKHDRDFQQSESFPVELSSQHNYTDGITFYYIHYKDLELGRYWRHPWRDGWIFVTFGVGDGIQQESDTDYEAIARIKISWEGII